VEERLEGVLFDLALAFSAILWIASKRRACSSSENCCKEAYIISAAFAAAFFRLAVLFFTFIPGSPSAIHFSTDLLAGGEASFLSFPNQSVQGSTWCKCSGAPSGQHFCAPWR